MSYFNTFPSRYYEFPDGVIRQYNDISIRPAVVDAVIGDGSNLESYTIKDGETPEIIAYDKYGDTDLHWTILLTNNIINIYTDWPLDGRMFEEFLLEKYRYVLDDSDIERKLTDMEVMEYVEFKGTPTNGFYSTIYVDSDHDIILRPHHFEDSDGNEYGIDSLGHNYDAFGRVIQLPHLTPVSIREYHERINEDKRTIYLPPPQIIRQMNRELGSLVNDRTKRT